MIFELAQDFHDAVTAMPREHPKHRMLELFEEAIRRDIHFIDRHPTTLFQCMWNTCWWYDCPEVERNYGKTKDYEFIQQKIPESSQSNLNVNYFLNMWHNARKELTPAFFWIRSLQPIGHSLEVNQIALLEGHRAAVNAVAITDDQNGVVSVSDDHTIKVWNISTNQCLLSFDCGSEAHLPYLYAFNRISISPDGEWAVCRRRVMNSEEIWNLINGMVYKTAPSKLNLSLHTEIQWEDSLRKRSEITNDYKCTNCLGVIESPESELIAFFADGCGVKIYDLRKYRFRTRLEGYDKLFDGRWYVSPYSNNAAMTPNGEMVLCADVCGTIYLWSIVSQHLIGIFTGHSKPVRGFAVTADGKKLISAGEDHTIRVWNLLQPNQSPLPRYPIKTVAYSIDNTCAVTETHSGLRHVWSLRTNQNKNMHKEGGKKCEVNGEKDISKINMNVKARDHFISNRNKTNLIELRVENGPVGSILRIYNKKTGKILQEFPHGGVVHCVRLMADGQHVISCSHDTFNSYNMSIIHDNNVRIWDMNTGHEQYLIRNILVNDLAIMPNEIFFVVAKENRILSVCNSIDGKDVLSFPTQSDIQWIALSPDGNYTLAGDIQENLYILEFVNLLQDSLPDF